MTEFTPYSALLGGAIIGLAAVLLLKLNGRIAGISGIVDAAFTTEPGGGLWRWLFLIGLVLGGLIYRVTTGDILATRDGFSVITLICAGLLVGFGARLGSGCTSGHGVCGIARLSPRSIVATFAFLATGMLVASLIHFLTSGP